jgi:hypothetical protein
MTFVHKDKGTNVPEPSVTQPNRLVSPEARLSAAEFDAREHRQAAISLPRPPWYFDHSYNFLAVVDLYDHLLYITVTSLDGEQRYEKPISRDDALALLTEAGE